MLKKRTKQTTYINTIGRYHLKQKGSILQKPPHQNNLSKEASPYLKQHQTNPVHWQPWHHDVLQLAKQCNKPILLSIGYSACHWCHVMAHESFENIDTAAIMNELYINIKVDREERPDLDHIYQQALAIMGEQGGWPLTLFLLPNGKPFSGGTYFPPKQQYGRPGFPELLKYMESLYRKETEKVEKVAEQITNAIDQQSTHTIKLITKPEPDYDLKAVKGVLAHMDMTYGGTHGAPKFPQPLILKYLWNNYLENKQTETANKCFNAVVLTLDAISNGGIYDHLAGGYSRYSTDEVWLAPHFEKMLYDNALIIDILTDVYAETGQHLYKTRIQETINWMDKELRPDTKINGKTHPAFAAALDADSEGIEGKFYIWQEAEIDEILQHRSEKFKKIFNVTKSGNWEHRNIINTTAAYSENLDITKYESDKFELLKVRNKRIRPEKDDKILADWNGLAIKAIAKAGAVCNQPKWIEMAASAYGYINDQMSPVDDELTHVYSHKKTSPNAMLDDYANMCDAALTLYQVTEQKDTLTQAIKWIKNIEENYASDNSQAGYYQTHKSSTDIISRPKITTDNVTPSGNGTLACVFAKLYLITLNVKYRTKAEELIQQIEPDNPSHATAHVVLLTAKTLLKQSKQIVIIGKAKTKSDKQFLAEIYRYGLSDGVVLMYNSKEIIQKNHPAYGKKQIDDKITIYMCRQNTCSKAITTHLELIDYVGIKP